MSLGPICREGLGTPPGEGDEADFLTTSQIEKRKTLLSGSQVSMNSRAAGVENGTVVLRGKGDGREGTYRNRFSIVFASCFRPPTLSSPVVFISVTAPAIHPIA